MTSRGLAPFTEARWHKSSYSSYSNQCVGVAQGGQTIAVRDSKNPEGGYLTFSSAEWRAPSLPASRTARLISGRRHSPGVNGSISTSNTGAPGRSGRVCPTFCHPHLR